MVLRTVWTLNKDLIDYVHPYTFNKHGSVLFCGDCWEEDGIFRAWDFGVGGVGIVTFKKVRNPSLCGVKLCSLVVGSIEECVFNQN